MNNLKKLFLLASLTLCSFGKTQGSNEEATWKPDLQQNDPIFGEVKSIEDERLPRNEFHNKVNQERKIEDLEAKILNLESLIKHGERPPLRRDAYKE